MPSEQPEHEQPTTTAPDTPPAEQPKLFTQEEVGRLLAQERKRARDAALKEQIPDVTTEKPAAEAPKAEHKKTLRSEFESMKRGIAFRDAIADYNLPREQRDWLLSVCEQVKPEDVGAWIKQSVGMLKGSQPASDAPAQAATKSSTARPASDRGAPSPRSEGEVIDNPLLWTESDVERVIDGAKSYDDGVRAVKEKFMRSLRGVQLLMPVPNGR